MMTRLYLASLLFILPITARAGGSLALDDISDLLESNPALTTVIETLQLAEVGSATRLGHHFGELAGARVSPFQFEGMVKGSGQDFPLLVTFHAKWSVQDLNGNDYGQDPAALPTGTELVISQVLERIEITHSKHFAPASLANPGKSDGAVEMPATPQANAPTTSGRLDSENHTYRYAGEFYANSYLVKVEAGDSVDVTFSSSDFSPGIISKQGGWNGSNGPRFGAQSDVDTASINWTATDQSELIIHLLAEPKGSEGNFEATFSINGEPVEAFDPSARVSVESAGGAKSVIPVN